MVVAAGGPGTLGSDSGTEEDKGDQGTGWSHPHFMQGTPTRPAGLHTLGPRVLPHVRPQEKPTSDLRWRRQGRKCWGILPRVTSGKSARGFRFLSLQETRLLKDCFGRETAASQQASCTSSNSPWEEEGSGGACIGDGGAEGRGEIPGEEVSRQQLASPHPDAPSTRAGGYLSSVRSGMPASVRAARNCISTPRMLLMKPLESGKRGKPMSG